MNKIGKAIRAELARRETKATLESIADEKYRRIIDEIVDYGVKSFTIYLHLPIEDDAHIKNVMKEDALSKYINSEELKNAVEDQARKDFSTYDEVKADFDQHYAYLKEKGVDEDELRKYSDIFEQMAECYRINDKIIDKMIKIADSEGIEKAVSMKNEIVREEFKDSEDCKKHLEKTVVQSSRFYSAMMAAHELSASNSEIVSLQKKIFEKTSELISAIAKDKIELELEAIYGKK